MTDREINDFLANHSGAKWFDSDLVLYKQKFPHSKILQSLENPPEFRKTHLDERMVHELLRDGGQCIDCIWEARGYMRNAKGFIVPMQKDGEINDFEKQLLELDLDNKPDYNIMKGIIFGLAILTTSNSKAVYTEALKERKASLIKAQTDAESKVLPTTDVPTIDAPKTDVPDAPVTDAPVTDAPVTDVTEKKSEDQEPNTQV